jgi:predicted phosphodiesterase
MRLHSRSGELLAAAVESLNKKKIDVLLVPGDVTDRSRPGEFDLFCKAAAKAKYPVITVPGNHDKVTEENLKHFNRAIPAPAGYREINGIQIVSLNTWDGQLNKPENAQVISKLDPKRPAIIQSHFQLIKSSDVLKNTKHAAISDTNVPEVKQMLEKIANSRAVVFVGHKNSADKALIGGKVTQINCPQLTQYPNGYLTFEANAEGVSVSYIPSSCVYIEEFSRRLAPSYTREKNALKCWNTFIPWGGK